MVLNISFWITILFLASMVIVVGASSAGLLPALENIGSSSYGLALTAFWLLGFIAMMINIIAMVYAMLKFKEWVWFIFSFLLAPFTTLFYYWAVYRKRVS